MDGPSEIANSPRSRKVAVCNTCTIRLVRLAYRQAPWFRLIREPLRLGMSVMAAWHRIDFDEYEVRTPSCYGCMRFYKVALKERSATFRWLNDRVNPTFDAIMLGIVKEEAHREAQAYARAASFLGRDGEGLRDSGTVPGTGVLADQGDTERDSR